MELRVLYFLTFLFSAMLSALCIPWFCRTAGKWLTDKPGGLKMHQQQVPMVGGCAIFVATILSLMGLRLFTNFPTGTLHSLRGVLGAGMLIFLLGLLDDLRKPKGLPVYVRLAVQVVAAMLLVYYGVFVQAFPFMWLNYVVTFLWLLMVTNAFNLLDIADGLCISQALICAIGLVWISLPGELWYVNFAALALAGAGLSFWPYNHKQNKVFLGDSGATFLGFMLAALAMGTQYSQVNSYGYAAPLFIMAVPLFDTLYVSIARVLQGKNPLKGSNDHLALCLKKWGWPNWIILLIFAIVAIACNLVAWMVTRLSTYHTQAVCVLALLMGGMCIVWLLQKLHTSTH